MWHVLYKIMVENYFFYLNFLKPDILAIPFRYKFIKS